MTLITNRLLLTALLCFGTLSGSANAGTQARFTTLVESTGNRFSAGTLHIAAGLSADNTLSLTNLVPGDSVNAQLAISNPGSLELTYAMRNPIISGTLDAQYLNLTVQVCGPDGALLYDGPLAAAHIGSTAHADHSNNRNLAPALASPDLLCFTVLLAPTTPVSQQDTNLTANFAFDAEQF